MPQANPGIPAGYLAVDQRPDSRKLLPPPPGAGSAAFAFDEDIRTQAVAMRGSARWDLATRDAAIPFGTDPNADKALQAFECALGTVIDPERTPRLFQMLQRISVDAAYSTAGVKREYRRPRPFMAHGDGLCTPEKEAVLRVDGSYPSGHTALGWAVGLALAQVAPERASELIARGRAYGESRLVCNVHWQSDVISGRVMGSAAFARVNAVPDYGEDLSIAGAEVAAARAAGLQPRRDCAAEAEALAQMLSGAL